MTKTNKDQEYRALYVELKEELYWRLKDITLKNKMNLKTFIVQMIEKEVEKNDMELSLPRL